MYRPRCHECLLTLPILTLVTEREVVSGYTTINAMSCCYVTVFVINTVARAIIHTVSSKCSRIALCELVFKMSNVSLDMFIAFSNYHHKKFVLSVSVYRYRVEKLR